MPLARLDPLGNRAQTAGAAQRRARNIGRTRPVALVPACVLAAAGGGLPIAALIGAVLVVTADVVGRTLFAPAELPAGIVVALLGAPFLVLLLWKTRNTAD